MTVLSTDGICPLGSSVNADRVSREVAEKWKMPALLSPLETSAVLPLSDGRWKVLPCGGGGVKARPRLADRRACGLGETLSLEGGYEGDRNPTLNPSPGCPGCPSSSCASASVMVTIYSSVLPFSFCKKQSQKPVQNDLCGVLFILQNFS